MYFDFTFEGESSSYVFCGTGHFGCIYKSVCGHTYRQACPCNTFCLCVCVYLDCLCRSVNVDQTESIFRLT